MQHFAAIGQRHYARMIEREQRFQDRCREVFLSTVAVPDSFVDKPSSSAHVDTDFAAKRASLRRKARCESIDLLSRAALGEQQLESKDGSAGKPWSSAEDLALRRAHDQWTTHSPIAVQWREKSGKKAFLDFLFESTCLERSEAAVNIRIRVLRNRGLLGQAKPQRKRKRKQRADNNEDEETETEMQSEKRYRLRATTAPKSKKSKR